MTIYLYVKTHRKTGLKYLGKTTQDPYLYFGSGIYWTDHLKKHGYDVDTEILLECDNNDEIKRWGLHYSELWNVVESNDWANLKPEEGDGNSSEQAKKMWKDPEYQKLQSIQFSKTMTEYWKNPETKTKQSLKLKQLWKDADYREKMSNVTRELWQDSKFREYMCELWNDPEFIAMISQKLSGENNPRYDHTLYHFIHDDGKEEFCTKFELGKKYPELIQDKIYAIVRGNRKWHKGWRVKSVS